MTKLSFHDLAQAVAPRVLVDAAETSAALRRLGIPHALVGGLAVGLHGHPRATKDVDFIVGREAFRTVRPLLTYRDDLHEIVSRGVGQVDLLAALDDDPVLLRALSLPAPGEIPVVPIEVLVVMKLRADRPQDRADITRLMDGLDAAHLRDFVAQNDPALSPRLDSLLGSAHVERLAAGALLVPDEVVQFSARWSPVGTLARTARGEDLTDDLPGIERIRDVRDRAYAEARAALRRVSGEESVERMAVGGIRSRRAHLPATQREMLQGLGFWSKPEEIDLDHARRHTADSPRDHAALIVAHRILTGEWSCHGPDVDALVRFGVHPWYTVVEVLREVDPEGEIEDPPKPEGMPEDRDAFAVERMAAAEPAWLDLDTVLAAVPAAAANDVSEVARSRRGFVAAYRDADGDPNALARDGHSGQDWRARRNAFVARHTAQGDAEGYWSGGAPTRRHLALVMWAYSPDPKRLRAWLSGLGR